jgi:hypothetical protein
VEKENLPIHRALALNLFMAKAIILFVILAPPAEAGGN